MSSASIQPESSLQAVENSSAAGSTDISFGDGVGEVLLELSKCEFSSKTMSGPDTEEFNCTVMTIAAHIQHSCIILKMLAKML